MEIVASIKSEMEWESSTYGFGVHGEYEKKEKSARTMGAKCDWGRSTLNAFGAGLNSSDSGRSLRRGVWVLPKERERNYARKKREKEDKKREKYEEIRKKKKNGNKLCQ